MLIVSDTSPITNLIQIGHLELLKKMFGYITIPEKVYHELSAYEGQHEIINNCSWIVVKRVLNKEAVKELSEYLDLGEAEAIILAKELDFSLLIIDERQGRSEAKKQGLEIIGLLGILVRGKQEGYISYVKKLLDKLIIDIGFRVSKDLYKLVLQSVGEW